MTPENLVYTAEHEWAALTESGDVRFGITDHAQEALGDIVFITLPEVGASAVSGAACGEVESTKSVADLYAPVSGRVAAVNEMVVTSPETINSDPYGAGWIAEITPTGTEPLSGLLSDSDYRSLVGEG